MSTKWWTALAASALLLACGAEDPYPSLLDEPGDPCRWVYPACVDDQTMWECVDDVIVERDCEETCSELGPAMVSVGCAVEGGAEGCVCEPEAGACAPGSTACESDTQLGYCGPAQVWELWECEELCAESLATPVSEGCYAGEDGVEACWCTSEMG